METQSAQSDVTPSMVESMRQTRPWVMLIAVLIFISLAFMVLGALFMMVGGVFIPHAEGTPPLAAIGAVYLVVAALYFFPGLFLVRYAGAIGRLTSSRAVADLEAALSHQKSFWKFVGIVTLVSIAIGILGVVAAIAIPLILGMR
jgi:hypothetical protein